MGYHFIYHVTDHLYCYGPLFSYAGRTPEEISYDKFLKLVDNKKVESVTFTNSRINIVLTDSARKEKLKGTLKEVKDESKKNAVHPKKSTEKSGTY